MLSFSIVGGGGGVGIYTRRGVLSLGNRVAKGGRRGVGAAGGWVGRLVVWFCGCVEIGVVTVWWSVAVLLCCC